jgi:hypothetical protein
VIPDRIIEQGTLTTDGSRAAVEVRLPWYRALPGSCISEVGFAVDGVPAKEDSLRWTMNGRTFRVEELAGELDEWWFPTDSVVVSGEVPVADESDQGVLRIEEHDTKTMKAAKS